MFVARERELSVLEDAYGRDGFEFVAVYGRRRVGKTALIREFVKNKPAVFFFTAHRTTSQENLALLSAAMGAQLIEGWEEREGDDEPLSAMGPSHAPIYPSVASALSALFDRAGKVAARSRCKPIIVIDEYPYLAESAQGTASALQVLIDGSKDRVNLLLILCGSSMSFMEHQVLGETSPLYGRRTRQLKVRPFDAFDAARLFPNAPAQRIAEFYGMAGGIPLYLGEFDAERSLERNMSERVFREEALLFGEPMSFLLQEVAHVRRFNAVLSAMAAGRTSPGRIADASGLGLSNVANTVSALEELGIAQRILPVGGKRSRRFYLCKIIDHLFRFWYALVAPNRAAVEASMGDLVASRVCGERFSTYMGPVFEDICRQWVLRAIADGTIADSTGNALLPLAIGSWWGSDPTTHSQTEIDIVCQCADDFWIVGECRWRNEPTGTDLLETLEHRSHLVGGTDKRLFVFSRSGFTRGALERASRDGRFTLVTLDDMFESAGCEGIAP